MKCEWADRRVNEIGFITPHNLSNRFWFFYSDVLMERSTRRLPKWKRTFKRWWWRFIVRLLAPRKHLISKRLLS